MQNVDNKSTLESSLSGPKDSKEWKTVSIKEKSEMNLERQFFKMASNVGYVKIGAFFVGGGKR